MTIPCINCPVFAICNSKVNDEPPVVKLTIFGLATECPILWKYLRSFSNGKFDLTNDNEGGKLRFHSEVLDSIKAVFGRKGNDNE